MHPGCGNAFEVWDTLKMSYETTKDIQVMHLKNMFYYLKMQESDLIMDHITKFKEIKDQAHASEKICPKILNHTAIL